MKKIRVAATVFVAILFVVTRAYAETPTLNDFNKMMQAVQKQIETMQELIEAQNQKIVNLEKKQAPIDIIMPKGEIEPGVADVNFTKKFDMRLEEKIGDADEWLKDLKFKGDFRLRYEGQHFSSGDPDVGRPRSRFRFRLRYGFEKKLMPDMNVGFYMCSGSLNDPASTNQTMDTNWVWKNNNIERAWAEYTPGWLKFGPIDRVKFVGGKFKNPFEKGSSKIIWDRDVRPEGFYQQLCANLFNSDSVKVDGFFTAGQLMLTEGSDNGADSELWAFQGGADAVINAPLLEKPMNYSCAVSYYDYDNFAARNNFGNFARGNPNITWPWTDLDCQTFDVVEFYNSLKFYPFDFANMENVPVKVFFDIATNTSDGAFPVSLGGHHRAWAIGAYVGSAKKQGDLRLGYEYRWIDPNSVPGAFNDSDFGRGHSDKRGSVINGRYMLTDKLYLNLACYLVNNVSANSILIDEEQTRFQVDLCWKF